MRNFQPFPLSFWDDDHSEIGPHGVLVMAYFMTHPRSQFSGIFRLNKYDHQRVELSPDEFKAAVVRCVDAGLMDIDWQFNLLRVNGWWVNNQPCGKSQVTCLIKKELKPILREIGPHSFIVDLCRQMELMPGMAVAVCDSKDDVRQVFDETLKLQPMPIVPQDGSIVDLSSRKMANS